MEEIKEQLKAYKKKFYINRLLQGILLCLAVVAACFLIFNLAEFAGNFGSMVRGLFLFTFIGLTGFTLVKWVALPLYQLLNNEQLLSDQKAARQIGAFFPEIKDKLLNIIQLSNLSQNDNSLISAGISQKTQDIRFVRFTNAVDLNSNRRYLKFVLPPLGIIAFILFAAPHILQESAGRIIQFDKAFANKAPFKFILVNKSLDAAYDEDFVLKVNIEGKKLPDQAYIQINDRSLKMEKNGNQYQYTFSKLQKSTSFRIQAAGFFSEEYTIQINRKPGLKKLQVRLEYPAYLGKKTETLENSANLVVPEGTIQVWDMETYSADKLFIYEADAAQPSQNIEDNDGKFAFKLKSVKTGSNTLQIKNGKQNTEEKIELYTEVIPDKFPEIKAESYHDSSMYKFVVVAGAVSDDYGLNKLKLFYKKTGNKDQNSPLKALNIASSAGKTSQNFFFTWNIDTLQLSAGEGLEYYLQVWDNDGVNGSKSSRSRVFQWKVPDASKLNEELNEEAAKTEKTLDKNLDKAQKLQNEFKKLQDKLKGKKTLSWQDKKAIEELLKKQQEFNKEVQDSKEQTEQTLNKQDRFKQESERIAEKAEMLQKLMNEILDDETKKMLEELKKLLEDKNKDNEVREMLDKMQQKDEQLQKELDRALEMYKQLQLEKKLESNINDLKKIEEKQEKLGKESEQKDKKSEELNKEQQKLNEDFKALQKEMQEMRKMNEALQKKEDIPATEKQEESIKKKMEDAQKNLEDNQKKSAGKKQQEAKDEMQEMGEALAKAASSMQQESTEENIEDLRKILENLLHLSFEQENLMKSFKNVNQQDPRYLALGQTQLQLVDDAKIIEDSLYALAKRVPEVESFVTREVGQLKDYMQQSVSAIRQRRPDMAAGKQQFAMTSANNLALMLNDVLKQLQEQMKSMKKGNGQCKKPGGKGSKPGLSEMQKKLNKDMQSLQKGGKTGRQMSEELAKMAAQQEMIRRAVKEMEGKEKGKESGGKQGGQPSLGQLIKEMEKTESDLVNKKLTQETINRQQEIVTRLLEAENAEKERDQEKQRESQQAKEQQPPLPPSFEKYLKEKQKQVELLKTLSPSLTPYYKQEVNEYFQKIEN